MIFTHADLDAFAAASGDTNPLHLSDDYARACGFEGRIVHGMLAVLRMLPPLCKLDGLTTVKFKRPLYCDVDYVLTVNSNADCIELETPGAFAIPHVAIRTNWPGSLDDRRPKWSGSKTYSATLVDSPIADWKSEIIHCCSRIAGQTDGSVLARAYLQFAPKATDYIPEVEWNRSRPTAYRISDVTRFDWWQADMEFSHSGVVSAYAMLECALKGKPRVRQAD